MVQFHIFVPNYSEAGYLLKMKQNLGLNYYRKQIKLKNLSNILLYHVKFQLLTSVFSVICIYIKCFSCF